MASKVFSFDAETNGLWGKPFSIAALVLDEAGAEVARFVGRCPIEGEANAQCWGLKGHPVFPFSFSCLKEMAMTLNFGTVAIRQIGAPGLPGSVGVWDGTEWVPWEEGTDEDRQWVREQAMGSALWRIVPEWMKRVIKGR